MLYFQIDVTFLNVFLIKRNVLFNTGCVPPHDTDSLSCVTNWGVITRLERGIKGPSNFPEGFYLRHSLGS